MTNAKTIDLEQLAASMVALDRMCGDLAAEVLADAEAGTADHWDIYGLFGMAETLGWSFPAIDMLSNVSWPAVRAAYAKAWRAAVELDRAADEVAS